MNYYLDSNCFIQPYSSYYPFDLAPGYWRFLEDCFSKNSILLINEVHDEIVCQKDDLAKWIIINSDGLVVPSSEQAVITNISNIANWVNQSNYSRSKKAQFQKGADQFVIAHAMYSQGTVVTCEQLSPPGSMKKIKIPNVCENFNVRWLSLFDFLREFQLRLS